MTSDKTVRDLGELLREAAAGKRVEPDFACFVTEPGEKLTVKVGPYAIALLALDKWEDWVRDELEGTKLLKEKLAEINGLRGQLIYYMAVSEGMIYAPLQKD